LTAPFDHLNQFASNGGTNMHRSTTLGIFGIVVCCILASPASAYERKGAGPSAATAKEAEVDSEHLFGFTQGTDVGDTRDVEGELESSGGIGKRSGTYVVSSTAAELKYGLADNFRVAPFFLFSRHDIENVPGLDDRHRFNVHGGGVELKYRLLDRERAPFGLTLALESALGRIDEATGERVEQYGLGFAALFDKELVAHRLYGALNISYDPQWTRPAATGVWERASTFAVGAALTNRVLPGLYLGGEARYLRAYDGIGLNAFAGEALYVGPTLYALLWPKTNMTLAWNMQVAGHAVGDPGHLDLVNFERHQVRLRFGVDF
jgi:hypothetical protein